VTVSASVATDGALAGFYPGNHDCDRSRAVTPERRTAVECILRADAEPDGVLDIPLAFSSTT